VYEAESLAVIVLKTVEVYESVAVGVVVPVMGAVGEAVAVLDMRADPVTLVVIVPVFDEL